MRISNKGARTKQSCKNRVRHNPLDEDNEDDESFNYVVNPPEIPKVCFGSSIERDVLPQQGPALSSFMRANTSEVRDYPGPSDYEIPSKMEKSYPSKLGFSVLISKSLRTPATNTSAFPPIGAYDVEKFKPLKQHWKPFGVGCKLGEVPKFLTPGPPTYPHHVPYPQPKLCTVFMSQRITWPEVAVNCSPYNTSKCIKCGETPTGDYWHDFKSSHDMCRPCMNKEIAITKLCTTGTPQTLRIQNELKKYQRMRYCIFFHDHNGTTAAMQLISKKVLRFKIKKENYLSKYETR